MKNFLFWQKWLFIVSLSIIGFGTFMAFFGGTMFYDKFINTQINPAFWGGYDVEDAAAGFQQWIYGCWGATIAGWGIFMAFIAQYPFKNKEKWSWNCLAIGVSFWFIIDTYISLHFKVYFNAFIINMPFFLFLGLPLVFSRKYFVQSKS